MTCKVIELRSVRGQVVGRELQRPRPARFANAGAFVMASGSNGNDFDKRVRERRVDLLKRIAEGVPPVEYLPASDGMLIRGKRHLIPGPKKAGKSIAMLVHWTRMAMEDANVVIFDRENGGNEYASRLDDIMTAWGLTVGMRKRIGRNLAYYAFPHFKPADGAELADLVANADVVVFDSARMFLTDLGLKEDSADDYSAFMNYLIDPLFRSSVATVILDNTGHSDQTRARATSAKGDLNEVLFRFEKEQPFSLTRQGRVKLSIADSRFGNEGEWAMHIGGGAFMPWERLNEQRPIDPAFRKAAEDVLASVGVEGTTLTKLVAAVRERVPVKNETARDWLHRLAADPDVNIYSLPPEKKGLPAMFYGGHTHAP